MLKSLRIANIILIEHAEIPFSEGFNVLTGETGSGKSAILDALSMIAGARAENHLLRHGADKSTVEAAFEIDSYEDLHLLLAEAGIDHEKGEELIIRRELSSAGKSRAFVNNQQAHVNLLRKIGKHLFEIVGQHANQKLNDSNAHREILDLFGDASELKIHFKECWAVKCRIEKEIEEIKNNEARRLREIEIAKFELEELEEANIKENEDEELFAEYTRLANSEELAKHALEIQTALTGEEGSAIQKLQRLRQSFHHLLKHDPSLKQQAEAFQSTVLDLQEIAQEMHFYHSRVEFNPDRLAEISARLSLLNKIKKKYGPKLADAIHYHRQTREKLSRLENAEDENEQLQEALHAAEEQAARFAGALSQKRQAAGTILEKKMKEQLDALNMPKAIFYVSITPQQRTFEGDDYVEFLFAPNVGEKQISIKECASGGELSRIMLAIQTLLAGKENIPTLIFDEIDANIGGETALVIGEKLREIGLGHQILCITHFPQVAKCACHHIQISKHEENGRTLTKTAVLDARSRKQELGRMSGQQKKA